MAQEIDWDSLDKRKFFVVGLGMFSGVTTCLYPLTVIKTRQMASTNVPSGLSGTAQTVRAVWSNDGVRGFYRGFGTVILGTIPMRVLYLNSLEITKSQVNKLGQKLDLAPTTQATLANAAGGAAASMASQAVGVPVDVVTQRLMVAGTGPSTAAQAEQAAGAAARGTSASEAASQQQRRGLSSHASSSGGGGGGSSGCSSSRGVEGGRSLGRLRGLSSTAAPAGSLSGLQMARLIVAQEGFGGLYRGFLPSVATYVPNSACWWGAYGFWQKLIWVRLGQDGGGGGGGGAGAAPTTSQTVGVQTVSALLAGLTSSVMTNPLDVIKTRLQVIEVQAGQAPPTWLGTLRQLLAQEGPRGLLRGVAPRMASSAAWGTAMVSTYEFLKRLCKLPEPAAA